jgi:hypothetical protein
MSRKKGHKLGGSFAPLLTHTRKSAAWQMLSVGARALFMELQSEYFVDIEGYVFLSTRDGAERLRTSKTSIGTWFSELEHYGFIIKVRDAHLTGLGEGEAAHYRLTDRYYHGQPPTRDFEKWDGVIFERPKRSRSPKEKAKDLERLRAWKNSSPVRRVRTPRPSTEDVRRIEPMIKNGNNCPSTEDVSERINCPSTEDVSRFTTSSAAGTPTKEQARAETNLVPMLESAELSGLMEWTAPTLEEIEYTEELRKLYRCEVVGKAA